MGAILERRRGAGDGDTVQRVGIEAVLDPLQRLDQIRMADRQPHTKTGQRTRLGERLRHQQIRITVHQCDGRLTAEIHIGLIDQHHGFSVRLQ